MNNQIKKFLFLIFQFIFFTNLKLCKTYQKYNSWTIKFFVKLNFYKIKIHSTRIFNIKHFIDNKYDTQDHLIDTIIDFEVISRDYGHDEIQKNTEEILFTFRILCTILVVIDGEPSNR